MKYVRPLPIAVLTFVLGVASSPIHFYVEGMGCGKIIDGGGGFSTTSYTSSDFVKLEFTYAQYVSPDKANQIFARHLTEAAEVIEVGQKTNKEGVVIGRRAMAVFYSPELSGYYTEIFWTDGRFLHYISSTSAWHVKEFEKHQR